MSRVMDEILPALENENLRLGLTRSVETLGAAAARALDKWPYLTEFAEYVRKTKEKVIENLDYYIDKTLKSVENAGGHSYFAKDEKEVCKIVDDIIGEGKKLIVKAKSMVTEEIRLREHLIERGHEVYETDLGELLIQLSGGKPMHAIAPAVHIPREEAAKLLKKIAPEVSEDMSIEEMVSYVRKFLREKFVKADIGISGANSIAADTGAIFLVSNEGNIRNATNLPPVLIAITGVDKIMPTIKDAFLQAIVQSGYAGLFPPTYLSLIAGPSSTADIEYHRVYGVHGAKEMHVILYDGGRIDASKNEYLREQLYCVRCGRCQGECPIWDLVGNMWGGDVYGGPMGMGWTAITQGIDKAAPLAMLCLGCGRCREVCPSKIDMPSIIRYLKTHFK